jgi:AraC-like DNA-binding protein
LKKTALRLRSELPRLHPSGMKRSHEHADQDELYREWHVKPAAARSLWCAWEQAMPASASPHASRVVPNGCVEVAYELGSRMPVLRGPLAGPVHRTRPGGTQIVGVRFRPGGAASVFRVRASELVGREVPLDQIWDGAATQLAERLGNAPSMQAAARLLEHEIASCAKASQLDPLVEEAVARLQPWRRTRIDRLARELFVSERNLRRRLIRIVGHGPKSLQRILRIQGFVAMVALLGRDLDLARAATRLGYADQAHLTRECRALTGDPPLEFARETVATCSNVHDHSATYAEAQRALTIS